MTNSFFNAGAAPAPFLSRTRRVLAHGALVGAIVWAPSALAQSAPQAVHDQDVFEQNKTILKQSAETATAAKDLSAALRGAVTRSRAFGRVADSGAVRMTVPDDGETAASIDATFARVRQLGCARPDKDGRSLPAEQLTLCRKIEQSAYEMVTMLRTNLERSRQRAQLIDALQAELDRTGDGNLKESSDLAARIQVETTLLQNEKAMVDMALAGNEQRVRLYSQLLSALESDGPGDPEGNRFNLKKK